MGAYGFGLNFRVRACVHASATISQTSDMYGLILFVLGTKTTHDGIHKHIILFCDAIKDDWLVAIFVVKKSDVEHVHNHFSDMYLPMLFNLGALLMNDGLHKHVIFFQYQIHDGRLVAILLLKHVPNHFLNMHGPVLIKLGKCHKWSCMSHDHSSQLHIHINLVNMA